MTAVSLMDWRDSKHWSETPKPCVLCDTPTHLRSERGKPVHKVCAEDWNDTRTTPDQTAAKRRRN
ncbi:hypothetical protein ABIA33_003990 [Streptacidiphilus sp. MAP12-16]|uniref:hypothetical protein n=1 Tax=Streptacidiphilus sp. MAP12-16 TaxID=3156300 RepID=UPI003515B286